MAVSDVSAEAYDTIPLSRLAECDHYHMRHREITSHKLVGMHGTYAVYECEICQKRREFPTR